MSTEINCSGDCANCEVMKEMFQKEHEALLRRIRRGVVRTVSESDVPPELLKSIEHNIEEIMKTKKT